MTKKSITSPLSPQHIAIIMDGNGRWSHRMNVPVISGHKAGAENIRVICQKAHQMGVKYLTLYTFSTENWLRPQSWVADLIGLLRFYLKNEVKQLIKNNIRLHVIGERQKFGPEILKLIEDIEEKTRNNTGLHLILALSYGGRSELTMAMKNIATSVLNETIKIDDITPDLISSHLYTHNFPDPDLLIRTSGEYRISNFLLWQMAYTEMIFVDKFWPDFSPEDMEKAIHTFHQRDRRYGAVIGGDIACNGN